MRTKTYLMVTIGFTLLLISQNLAAAAENPQHPPRSEQSGDSKNVGNLAGSKAQPASQDQAQPRERAFGTITSVGVDRLEIKKMDGTTQTVMVNDQTRYGEGQWREGRQAAPKQLQLEDLKPGDRVFVRGQTGDNKAFIASAVRRVTEQDVERFNGERAFGEITSIDGNQLRVRNQWQGEKTIVVNEETMFRKEGELITLKDLKPGDRIFALGKETNGQFVAARVVTGQFRRGGEPRRERQGGPEHH